MRKRELLCALLFCNALISQNLLDTSTWTIGSGSVTGFSQHGRTAENSRAYGKDRLGNNVILWKATPDATSGADGGWNSAYYSVDSNKPYRFSVWIKKTTSTSGTTYFGFDESSDKIRGLNGTSHDNPYFWSGDLPRLGRWYLLVGFVHESSYTSRASQGAIYDGVTGKIVKSIMDYKMESSAVTLRHRSHLSYDTNASNQQYFYAPRMELLSGSEPTIQDLLGVHPGSKVTFTYDVAGNQTHVLYCSDQSCTTSSKSAGKQKEVLKEAPLEMIGNVEIYPNPTKGAFVLRWENEAEDFVSRVTLTHIANGNQINLSFKANLKSIEVDMTSFMEGVYIVELHLKNGKRLAKKIVKI